MKKNTLKLFLTAMALLSMMALAGCGLGKSEAPKDDKAAAGKPIELKLAYQLPAEHYLSKNIELFAKNVNEKSKGQIKITTYPAGQLYNDKSMNDAIMNGGLDIGLNSTAMWTTVVPELAVLDVPFLMTTYDSVTKAMTGDFGKTLSAELEKKGVHPLIWADYGYIQVCNNKRPLKKPEDFKGLQIRGYGQIPAETIKALGASPVTMGSSEVYMGIQRGTIDGQVSGTTATFNRKIYEVAKYLTMTNHAFCEFVVAMNGKTYDKLSADQKKILSQCAEEARAKIHSETKSADLKAMEDLAKAGMEVYQVPADEVALWQEATKQVRDDFIKNNPKLGKTLVDQCLAANK